MNENSKIQQLWKYLKIQDNEALIIQLYNPNKDVDEFLVVEKICGKLETHTICDLKMIPSDESFKLVQQRDSSGKHVIPSVKRIKRDEFIDY